MALSLGPLYRICRVAGQELPLGGVAEGRVQNLVMTQNRPGRQAAPTIESAALKGPGVVGLYVLRGVDPRVGIRWRRMTSS